MDAATRLRRLLDDPCRLIWDDDPPVGTDLSRWLVPLPGWLENFGSNITWPAVVINLVGTAFGFWYYGYQFGIEPATMWPLVPDDPVATLFITLSFMLWELGRSNEHANALAFFGCLELGLWMPYVLLAFKGGFSCLHWAMYSSLFWSHLAMVAETFLIQRYAEFPTPAVLVAVGQYTLNDLLGHFVPIVGTPHHTLAPAEPAVDDVVQHVSPAHECAAAGTVLLTAATTFLVFATRVTKLERGAVD